MLQKYIVHIEDERQSRPRPHEKVTAEIIAKLFESDIVFLKRGQSKNPDLYILKTNTRWELKSPTGNGKHNIQNNLRDANHQSANVILDLHRSKLPEIQAVSRAKDFIKTERHTIKRLKILTKDNKIIDIVG